MKRNLFTIMVLSVCLCFMACGDEKIDGEITISNEGALTQTVNSYDTIGTALNFTTKGAWSATIGDMNGFEAPSWISIDPVSGGCPGDYTMNFALETNYLAEDRTAHVSIISGNSYREIIITQKGANYPDNDKKDRKITKITFSSHDQEIMAMDFQYDTQGRVTKITYDSRVDYDKAARKAMPTRSEIYYNYLNLEYEEDIVYVNATGHVEGDPIEENNSFTINLNQYGYASDIEEGYSLYSFEYNDDNQIIKVSYGSMYEDSKHTEFRWGNNLLTGAVTDNIGCQSWMLYSNLKNNFNLDLNYILCYWQIGAFNMLDPMLGILDLYGKRSDYMINSYNELYDGWHNYSGSLKYELNKDGYVIKAIYHDGADKDNEDDLVFAVYY